MRKRKNVLKARSIALKILNLENLIFLNFSCLKINNFLPVCKDGNRIQTGKSEKEIESVRIFSRPEA